MSYSCVWHPGSGETPGSVQLQIREYVVDGGKGHTVTEGEMRCSGCTRKWLAQRTGAKNLPHYETL